MIRHLPGLPWPPVLQSGDLVQSLPQMASRSMNDQFQQWINRPFSPRFSRSDPRWWHLSGLGAQRRCCVVSPVSPGASGQTILGHGSYGRDQKHRVAASRLFITLEKKTWYDSDMKWYDMIWHDIKWSDMICYGAIWYVIATMCIYVYTIWLINKMNSIKSANVMSLCMIRRHYINGTICARHILKLFIPSTFYNSPDWQAYV